MSDALYRTPHLDAEQLNAFAEGALSEHERLLSLAHLAECAHCREIVFLAQESLPPATSPEPHPVARRWFAPFWIAGAALACTVLVAIMLHFHRVQPVVIPEQTAHVNVPPPLLATNQTPPAAPPVHTHSINIAPLKTQVSPAPEATTQPSVIGRMSMSSRSEEQAEVPGIPLNAPLMANKTPSVNDSMLAAPSPHAESLTQNFASVAGTAAAAPADSLIQNLPMNGRNTSAKVVERRAVAAPQVTLDALASDSTSMGISDGVLGAAVGPSMVTGSVTDASGAVIPGAIVTVRQLTGTASNKAVTNKNGTFLIAGLPAGAYEMRVESRGFEPYERKFDLRLNDLAQLNEKLNIGAESEMVTVNAAAVEISQALAKPIESTLTEPHPLPSKLPIAMTVASGKVMLALDTAANLFFSHDAGKHWKTVKPQWLEKITKLTTGDMGITFQLTTASGAVWFSSDGEHWHKR